MSVTPGYDFTVNEEVTAAKLQDWIIGSYDSSIAGGYTGAYVSVTAITSVSLANEGDLLFDQTRGTIEVQTRWGPVPVIGRGMFTRRMWMRAAGAPDNVKSFSSVLGWGDNNQRQSLPISTCSQTDWTANFGIEWNPYNINSGNPSGQVYTSVVIQPTQSLLDGGDYTCISCLSNANHHLLQLRGFTPLAATHITNATLPESDNNAGEQTIVGVQAEDIERMFYSIHSKSFGSDFVLNGKLPTYFGPCFATKIITKWYKYTL